MSFLTNQCLYIWFTNTTKKVYVLGIKLANIQRSAVPNSIVVEVINLGIKLANIQRSAVPNSVVVEVINTSAVRVAVVGVVYWRRYCAKE